MSMLRKTVLTTAVIGAGLASTGGAAFAGEAPSSGPDRAETPASSSESGGCSNTVLAENSNGAGSSLADVLGGDQSAILANVCDIANGNSIANGTSIALLDSSVRNGDNTTVNSSSASGDGATALLGGLLG